MNRRFGLTPHAHTPATLARRYSSDYSRERDDECTATGAGVRQHR